MVLELIVEDSGTDLNEYLRRKVGERLGEWSDAAGLTHFINEGRWYEIVTCIRGFEYDEVPPNWKDQEKFKHSLSHLFSVSFCVRSHVVMFL